MPQTREIWPARADANAATAEESTSAAEVPVELLRKLSVPGPRYTSYPTAPVFSERFGPDDFAAALRRFGAAAPARPLSLYVHLPFCRSLCHYCACNVVITRKPGVAARYLDSLACEIATAADLIGVRPARVTQLHLGGGTPTYLTAEELERLCDLIAARFDLSALEEAAVEVDPRVTSEAQLAALARRGFNRASFGVQDFDPLVQRAINRRQSVPKTEALIRTARELGYKGINIDLIYGLPFQRPETFAATVARVIALRPDRIALYSYAHVPWMRRAQTSFEMHEFPLPSPEEKIALFRLATAAFGAAGYIHLGMDHFALPGDELALARTRGRLYRNFQGYTVKRADDLLALGVSAISDIAGVYAQNEKELFRYEETVRAGRLATVRGHALTADDVARRRAIMTLMCGDPLPADFAAAHPDEVAALAPLERDGLVERVGGTIAPTALGRFFVRNIAMAFDRYLESGAGRFSKTV